MGWNTTIDWSSPDAIRNDAEKYLAYLDIQSAVNERCKAAGISVIPANELVQRNGTVAVFLLGNPSRSRVDDKINSLIGAFVNHTDNSGNWDGQPTIPVWSESSLETAIGMARPAYGGPGQEWSADWMYWMRECLDRLVWTKVAATNVNIPGDPGDQREALFANWGASSWYNDVFGRAFAYAQDSPLTGYRFRGHMYVRPVTTDYSCAVDFYGYAKKYSNVQFDDEGLGMSENTYHLIESDTYDASELRSTTSMFGSIDTFPFPSSTYPRGWELLTYQGFSPYPYGVCKWNVTNGFEYVA